MADAVLRPTPAQWLAGARPRTLPAAISPVLAGAGVAAAADGLIIGRVLLAMIVSLALQVGVNYANDYSDGIRGTDRQRVGPLRLVGSGVAEPRLVKRAAFVSFGVAALAGLALVIITAAWWLLIVGVACVAAAWFYTGGANPYGYRGLGEVFVFVFFGLVAVGGTVYVQLGTVTPAALVAGTSIGALACAILVANNLRDLDGDRAVGKRTLATRLGDRGTRLFYLGLIVLAKIMIIVLAVIISPWLLLALLGLLVIIRPLRTVLGGARGSALITVLKATGSTELVVAVLILVGCLLA